MKKTTTFILGLSAMFAFNTAKAQFPTITSANQLHSPGDSLYYIDLNSFGFDPIPAGGSNLVWNYSSLFASGTTVNFVYKAPATQDSSALFPTANASMVNSEVTGNEWFLESTNSIIRLGISSPDQNLGSLVYDNGSFVRFSFPFTAGDSWATPNYTGTQSGDFGVAGTIVTVENGAFQATVDAFGTMTLPNGTVMNDVVRVHIIESFDYMGDIGIGAPLNLGTISDDYFYWFVEGVQDPIMISGSTDAGSGNPTVVLRYQPILSTGVSETVLDRSIELYPNPSTGLFNLNMKNIDNGNYMVKVINVLGETAVSKTITVSNNKMKSQFDLSGLNKGVYFVSITGVETQITKRIIIK